VETDHVAPHFGMHSPIFNSHGECTIPNKPEHEPRLFSGNSSTEKYGSPYKRVLTTFPGRAMAQAVSRRPLIAEARVRSGVSPCGICVGQSGTGTGFSPKYFGFTLSISFHRCSSSSQGCTISLKAAVRS
jgi:hypothetical protein